MNKFQLELEFIKHTEVMKTLAKEQQQECDDVLLWLTRSNADFLSSVKYVSIMLSMLSSVRQNYFSKFYCIWIV